DWGDGVHTAEPTTITQNLDGSYTVTSNRPVYTAAGAYTVTVSISEDSGNVSTTVTDTQKVVLVNLVAPPVVVLNQPAGFTVTDVAQPGRPVYLYDADGNGLGFGLLDSNGHATVSLSFQTPGTHIVTAVWDNSSDPTESSVPVTVDVVLPFL